MVTEPTVRVNTCVYLWVPRAPIADPLEDGKDPPAAAGAPELAFPAEVELELEPATTVCAGEEWLDTA
jgi:hypothetical protein